MNNFFKYFHFNTVERNAFIVLAIAVLLVNLSLFFYKHFKSTEEIPHQLYNLSAPESVVTQETESIQDYSKPYSNSNKTEKAISYFTFDPNTITASDWERLGLSAKQI